MAIIFLLGPSEWDPQRGKPPRTTPMRHRRQIAGLLEEKGHRVLLMEDEKDQENEDLVDKFDRLLTTKGVTDIVVYWPQKAKMQTTYDELILLRDRVGSPGLPNIWVLHHTSVAEIKRDEFIVRERGGRSRYLTAVAKLGVTPIEWQTTRDLMETARLLAGEL